MAEHHSGPAELGAPMDYAEHEKTYNFFLEGTKFVTIFCVALLIAMAAGFFTSAGFFTAFALFVLLNIAGFVLLR
ncbi:aa3-type cytochrome c oxidase subunit IV [Pararhizobium sp.]|uniref:aa3-type cytochrome c oxidase subunit IV n=1 Tax=Pararhizobium sp. TaxID=1977563 RepID=UPI003D0A2CA6